MGKLKRMDQGKTILSTYLATKSIKATARRLQLSKNTIRTYLRRIKSSGKEIGHIINLSDGELQEIFYEKQADKQDRESYFIGKLDPNCIFR